MILGEVKRVFNPEFLNRLDEIIIFNALTDDDLLKIIDLLVEQINQHVAQRNVTLQMSPEARQWVLQKTCTDRTYGARPLRRALQKYIEDPLSEGLITGQVQPPTTLEVIVENSKLGFRPVREPTPALN
jgi:ATP-dependent Clp protease ATP-binding subunit ClpC